jgi:hypothetical protein
MIGKRFQILLSATIFSITIACSIACNKNVKDVNRIDPKIVNLFNQMKADAKAHNFLTMLVSSGNILNQYGVSRSITSKTADSLVLNDTTLTMAERFKKIKFNDGNTFMSNSSKMIILMPDMQQRFPMFFKLKSEERQVLIKLVKNNLTTQPK